MKGKRIEFYTENYIYYLKCGELVRKNKEFLLGGDVEFSSSEESLEYIEGRLDNKSKSEFLVSETDLDFLLETTGDTIEDLDVKKVIMLREETMQLILSENKSIDIYELKDLEFDDLEALFESVLQGKINVEIDTWINVKNFLSEESKFLVL